LQPADIPEIVVVVIVNVASVPVKDAGVVGQQILLLRPNVGEWLSPKFDPDLPFWSDSPGGKTALDNEQGGVRSELLQAEWRFILADLELRCRKPRSANIKRHSRSEEHTSELQSRSDLVCRLLL